MKVFENIAYYLEDLTNIKSEYFILIFKTLLIYIVLKTISILIIKVFNKILKDNKQRYNFTQYNRSITAILFILCTIFIWEEYISSLMTLISFISAAVTFSLRDIVFNYFAGIYIRLKKPFVLEDRIEIDGRMGDVINLNNLSFEILEVINEDGKHQSSGKIIHLPNSSIFKEALTNQTKAFKYIWNEITIKVELDSDLKRTKSILYRIVNSQEVIKRTPKRMENILDHDSGEYRIYYNRIEPVIYTRIVDDHIELSIRYLINPKKNRYIESRIYEEIINAYNSNEIKLIKS